MREIFDTINSKGLYEMKASTTKKARTLHRNGGSIFNDIPAGMGEIKRGKILKKDSDTTIGIVQKDREIPMGIPS